MSLRPRPEVENLEICPHGSINYAELEDIGLSPEEVIDFSVCLNPFMPPPGVKKILNSIAIAQYPDSEATELTRQLATALAISRDNILVGSGTTELIRLIALAYFNKGDPVLILEPTYGEYEVACRIVGASPVKQRMKAEDNFALRADETVKLVRQHHPRAIFICNPNNPTGKYFSRQDIETVLKAGENSLLILDEAYVSFADHSWSSIDLISRENVIILRSMTKDYALAGLRLGYAIANQEIINILRRVRPPWNVNIVAQKAGISALANADQFEQSKRKIKETKRFLIEQLSRLGLRVLSSDANFFLVKTGNAREFRATLLKKAILVRDCSSFGLPEYIRLAPRTMPECRKLIAAIKALKIEGGRFG